MAEKTPEVRNTKLLLVALGLGLLVAVVYNVHVQRVREAGKGEVVYLLRAGDDLEAGDEVGKALDRGKITLQEFPKKYADGLGPFIRLEREDEVDDYRREELVARVEMGQFLRYGHVDATARELPSARIAPDKVGVTLLLDAERSPAIPRQGDRVDVLVPLILPGEGMRYYRALEAVRVHSIGGEAAPPDRGQTYRRTSGPRSYKKIDVELDPSVAVRWHNLTTELPPDIGVRLLARSSHPDARYDEPGGFTEEFRAALERAGKLDWIGERPSER